MSVLNDISELLNAKVISQETADKIEGYYNSKKSQSGNRLYLVFGILGSILVGLGIILIIAHNWDHFSKFIKTTFAFLPLVIGQLLCGYVLLKKPSNDGWKESSAAFLFFTVGASISLVSQIYNIPGNLSTFLLTWMLLCLPVVYVLRSSIVSLLYICGITYYAGETSYWSYPSSESYTYWLLLTLILPHYYQLYKNKPSSNFMVFHNWVIPLSIVITLGTVGSRAEELMYIAYISLFGCYYMAGNSAFFKQQRPLSHGYKIIGAAGSVILLLILSFDWFWEDLRTGNLLSQGALTSPEFIFAVTLTLAATALFYLNLKNRTTNQIQPIEPVFIAFVLIFIIGLSSFISVVLINLLIFLIGILTILKGAKTDHLGILNYGLLIITILVICRFFDTDLSFIVRGLLFVAVGVGFFLTNYRTLKKRKAHESQ